MHHVAIMKKSWGFLEKIHSGEKTIESRWYVSKSAPWGKITKGDTVFFKDTGGLVSAKADVSDVVLFSDLTPRKVREILDQYGNKIGIDQQNMEEFFEHVKNKKYCILIFLEKPCKIEPFQISKQGFGMMSAWITVEDISLV